MEMKEMNEGRRRRWSFPSIRRASTHNRFYSMSNKFQRSDLTSAEQFSVRFFFFAEWKRRFLFIFEKKNILRERDRSSSFQWCFCGVKICDMLRLTVCIVWATCPISSKRWVRIKDSRLFRRSKSWTWFSNFWLSIRIRPIKPSRSINWNLWNEQPISATFLLLEDLRGLFTLFSRFFIFERNSMFSERESSSSLVRRWPNSVCSLSCRWICWSWKRRKLSVDRRETTKLFPRVVCCSTVSLRAFRWSIRVVVLSVVHRGVAASDCLTDRFVRSKQPEASRQRKTKSQKISIVSRRISRRRTCSFSRSNSLAKVWSRALSL